MNKRIVLFGGTFDPIHNGHLHLALACRNAVPFDRMILIPAHLPPHKDTATASDRDRLALCRLAAEPFDWIEVSTLELEREGPSYTIDTVSALEVRYPGAEILLLIGSDMLYYFEHWFRYRELLQKVTVLSAVRENAEDDRLVRQAELLRRMGGNVKLIPAPALPLSSTKLREKLRRGEDISGFLPPQAAAYIREHHLYKER